MSTTLSSNFFQNYLPDHSILELQKQITIIMQLLFAFFFIENIGSLKPFFAANPANMPDTLVFSRLQDCFNILVQGPIVSARHIIKRILALPVAMIATAFEIVAIIGLLALLLFQGILGISLNILHLVINNIILDTFLHGVLLNTLMVAFCFIPAIWHDYSRIELRKHLIGLAYGIYSIVIIIRFVIFHFASCLLGTNWLWLDHKNPEKQYLKEYFNEMRPHKDVEWFFGLKRSVVSALQETKNILLSHLKALWNYITYILSTPIFAVVHILQLACAYLCAIEKTLFTVPVVVLATGSDLIKSTLNKQHKVTEKLPELANLMSIFNNNDEVLISV